MPKEPPRTNVPIPPAVPAAAPKFSAASGTSLALNTSNLTTVVPHPNGKSMWGLYKFPSGNGIAVAYMLGNGGSPYEVTPIKWNGSTYVESGASYFVGDAAAVNAIIAGGL
jgi:hypothetical protein